jgi:hypothetical protein
LTSALAERSITVGFSVFWMLVVSMAAASDAHAGTFHAKAHGCTA